MPTIAYDPSRLALYRPEAHETVFVSATAYAPRQLAVEAARLAYVRAEASARQAARLAQDVARAGFDTPVVFADHATGSQGFACARAVDDTIIVSFRGTQPDEPADMLCDLLALMKPWPESQGLVHQGFARAACALLPAVQAWLEEHRRASTSLILTGHSLGAAIATLVASVVRPARLITLGSPRVGDASFAQTLTGIDCTRIVNCCDAVAGLPPPISGYTHVGALAYVTHDGAVLTEPDAQRITRDRAEGLDRYPGRYWIGGDVLLRQMADHAPINYVRAFFS